MNYRSLFIADFNNIRRDPMLLMASSAPVIILLLLILGYPALDVLLQNTFSISINAYYGFACVFMLHLIPMLLGMVYGFILLDERDEGMITYFVVTPLGKRGYLTLRMFAPVLFSFVTILVFVGITNFDDSLIWWKHVPLALITAFQAPIILLFLGGFAANKVEGMAVAKGFGILLMAIPVDYFFSSHWTFFAGISPLFWTARGLLAENIVHVISYIAVAFVMHAIFLFLLFSRFKQLEK